MSALDKLIALSNQGSFVPVRQDGDPAAELVMAALSDLEELRVLLASAPDKEDEDKGKDGGSTDQGGKGGSGHDSHPLFKKLLAKKVDPKRAASMCSQADKRVKAAALTEAAIIALSGLAASEGDWVEVTALNKLGVPLSGKKPYGDVTYADPGHQKDGKSRYPVDTPEHTRAAWSYVNQKENASKYAPEDLAKVKAKIKSAMKKHGIKGGDDGDKVEASYVVELAAKGGKGKPVLPPQNMHHGAFTGAHSHGHAVQSVHEHEHFHNNDSSHDFHAHNGDDSGQQFGRDRDW